MLAAPRRATSARVALVLVGSAVSSYGYLMTTRAHVGNGPMFAVQDALHGRTGMPLGLTAVVAGLSLAGLAALLGVRLGVAPLLIPVLTGVSVALLEPFAPHVDGLLARWVCFGLGTAVMMLGSVVVVTGGFGASAVDSAMFGIAKVARSTPARARIGLEVAMALTGFVLGGRIGPGTVAMAVSVGPLFEFWTRRLHGPSSPLGPAPATGTLAGDRA